MSAFWQMFWADALWSLVWLLCVSVPMGIGLSLWRRRKARAAKSERKERGRRIVVFLDADPPPAGKCPLCARDWPLEGPLYPAKEEVRR